MTRTVNRCRPLLLALALTLSLAGCGEDKATAPVPQPTPDPLPPGTPLNDTPANTLIRLERAYENQVLDSYLALLTDDFRFEFSSQSDPTLVLQYGLNWGVDDESASTRHLYDGFTNEEGSYMPGAAGITMSLPGPQIINDPDYPDSAVYYKLVVVPAMSVLIDIQGNGSYEIAAPQDIRLVRGDAAFLHSGQPADTTRWYVRRWTDKATSLGARPPERLAPAGVLPASSATLGFIKAMYR